MQAYFVELNDIGVSHFLEDVDLSGNSLNVALVFDAVLLENFDRNLLSRDRVRAYTHLTESAGAERAS